MPTSKFKPTFVWYSPVDQSLHIARSGKKVALCGVEITESLLSEVAPVELVCRRCRMSMAYGTVSHEDRDHQI